MMDFFDKAVNKTKEAFDVACKKTNEVVSVQKQKFDISTLQSKKSKDFESLGQIYFELIKDQPTDDKRVLELVHSINEKDKRIAELQAEICSIKNKRVCPSCGAYIDNSSTFCSACGTKITFENEE